MIGLSDGLGTTLETQYRYEPYGKTRVLGQASCNTQQYTGRENDATGLYCYRGRYYDPGTGRFVSPDPIGWAAGQTNGYAYVGGDPVGYRDPLGLNPAAGWAAGAAVGGPVDALIGGAIGAWVGWNVTGPILADAADGPSLPVDLPEKIPDFDFNKPGECPVDKKGKQWPWRGKPPQGGKEGGCKNPNGPESLHPDLDHGGAIGPHWDFNDRSSSGYRIGANGVIYPK